MSRGRLTTTSYTILGLLAIKPWTTYELTQQMDRSFNHFWPRSASKLYEEPKKLVAHGFATASKESVGRRKRTVYAITPQGRQALAEWLEQPGEGPSLEFEQLIKVVFAEHGTKEAALANVRAAKEWAARFNAENTARAREFLAGEAPFPERMAVLVVAGKFLGEYADTVQRWGEWAEAVIEAWPDDPRQAEPELSVLEEQAAREP